MARHRLFILYFFALFSGFVLSQRDDTVYQKLVRRYGSITPWGNGYIVKAHSLYGFADLNGHIVLEVLYPRFDTLLPDLADIGNAYRSEGLVNASGVVIPAYGANAYRLVNRRNRVLSKVEGGGKAYLYDDKGRQLITDPYDTLLAKETMVRSVADAYPGRYGIMTLNGETILPNAYQEISIGKKIYAALRNDTAYVFERNKGLLFRRGGVQQCKVLDNDQIVLKKFTGSALVDRSGKPLTEFTYTDIKSVYSSWPELMPMRGYLLAEWGEDKGLLDSTGKELFPVTYREIVMNSSGWIILKTWACSELLDPGFRRVLKTYKTNADIRFIDRHYAYVKEGGFTELALSYTYDMAERRVLKKKISPEEPRPERVSHADPYWVDPRSIMDNNAKHPDSLLINTARSYLLKRKGRWGVLSCLGDTILPFSFDTAGSYKQYKYFVGNKGKVAALDWEGNLTTPVGLDQPPDFIRDGLAISWTAVYSFKGWKLRKTNLEAEGVPDPYQQVLYCINYESGSPSIKRGIYNRHMKRLSDNFCSAIIACRVAIKDSTRQKLAVIDSTGRPVIPWMKAPRDFLLLDNGALAINDTGKADVVFRFDKDKLLIDTVWLNAAVKKKVLYPDPDPRVSSDGWQGELGKGTLTFEGRGQGRGVITGYSIMFIERAERIIVKRLKYTQVKISGKWGLYDHRGNQILAPAYDSIQVIREGYRLYAHGKTGLFIPNINKLCAPVYDSIFYYGGPDIFLIGYKRGEAEFVRKDDKVIAKGWKSGYRSPYYITSMYLNAGIPAMRNGKAYLLFSTDSDSLKAVPDTRLPEGTTADDQSDAVHLVLDKGGRKGVYNVLKKQWLIPPEYDRVKEEGDYFIAISYAPQPVLSLFTGEGEKMFSLNNVSDPPSVVSYYQWKGLQR